MTEREAYVFGWIYGRVLRCFGSPYDYDPAGERQSAANMYPLRGFAQIHDDALRLHLLTPEVRDDITAAVSEISNVPDSSPIPEEKRGQWQLGYYCAMGGGNLQPAPFDIAAARAAKGLTQADLANLLGVNQPTVARWEKGTVTPRPETLSRIKAALAPDLR